VALRLVSAVERWTAALYRPWPLAPALALICRVIFHVLSSVDFIFSSARFILEKGRDAQFSVPLIKPSHHFGRAIVDFSEALIANGGES
jgi:hypothetical protein